jgi:hypothetical protein
VDVQHHSEHRGRLVTVRGQKPRKLTPASPRYRVGCAGMFMLAEEGAMHLPGYDDADEAIVACETGPLGCEVYDSVTKEWIGPSSMEEIDLAKARLAERGGGS